MASSFRLYEDPPNDPVVDEDIRKKRVEEKPHLALGQHLHERVPEHLGISLGYGPAEGIGDVRSGGLEEEKPIKELLGNSADGLASLPIEEAQVGHAGTGHAPNLPVLLHEERLRPGTARRDGGDGPGSAPANDDHIDFRA